MMGLFSALFAVGLVLFVESANRKGYRIPVLLSLWRNLLLFCFGMIHIVFMYVYIDILWAYAVLSPVILFLRNKRISLLLGIFFATIFISIFTGFFFQSIFNSPSENSISTHLSFNFRAAPDTAVAHAAVPHALVKPDPMLNNGYFFRFSFKIKF